MVFFSCGACGESVKKNQVDKHYQTKCRNCNVLSCIDCGKDFWGDDYKEHTKCISEEEKYSGKDYKPKPGANKGEIKQELWINQVRCAAQKAPSNPKLKELFGRLEDYPNIPRKKAKFENFLKNSMRVFDQKLTSQVWELISVEISKKPTDAKCQELASSDSQEASDSVSEKNHTDESSGTAASSEKTLSKRERKEMRRQEQAKQEKKDKRNAQNKENGVDENVADDSKDKRKRKKRKRDDDENNTESSEVSNMPKKKKKVEECPTETEAAPAVDAEADEESAEVKLKGKFKWEAAIIGALLSAQDSTLSIKKLKKKVMAQYAAGEDGGGKTEEKLLAKFHKKINNNPRLKVHKDRVQLKR